MKNLIDLLIYLFGGLPIIFAIDEDDPELDNNPRKKARIRRKWRRERRGKECCKHGADTTDCTYEK
jgi:hypothetical protein